MCFFPPQYTTSTTLIIGLRIKKFRAQKHHFGKEENDRKGENHHESFIYKVLERLLFFQIVNKERKKKSQKRNENQKSLSEKIESKSVVPSSGATITIVCDVCVASARCLDQSLRARGRNSHGSRLPFDFHGG